MMQWSGRGKVAYSTFVSPDKMNGDGDGGGGGAAEGVDDEEADWGRGDENELDVVRTGGDGANVGRAGIGIDMLNEATEDRAREGN